MFFLEPALELILEIEDIDGKTNPKIDLKKKTSVIFIDKSSSLPFSEIKNIDKNLLETLLEEKSTARDMSGDTSGDRFQYSDVTIPNSKQTCLHRLLIFVLEDRKLLLHDDWVKLGGSVCRAIGNDFNVEIMLDGFRDPLSLSQMTDFFLGLYLWSYQFDKYKQSTKLAHKPNQQFMIKTVQKQQAIESCNYAQQLMRAVFWTRDLVNEPANKLGTVEFKKQIEKLTQFGVKINYIEESELETIGLHALLAVGKGSSRPSCLVTMQWQGAEDPYDPPIAFVGKGVVFDSGGISIKPAKGMEEMKGDMAGAAAVVGAMHVLAERKARANIVAVVGLVENMPDGDAMRPGDVLTALSGETIEVNNTDAEGRLVLADALYYTQKQFSPRVMIDLATLTGAIVVALGQYHAGLYSNDQKLSSELYSSGLETGERLWQMPLAKEYDRMIRSKVADICNSAGSKAGSITAAQFLQHFVGDSLWAHLDIAGTAIESPKNEYNRSWASGFGVRLLDHFVAKYCETASQSPNIDENQNQSE